MHIGEILKADSANGTGIRVSVFVSGCTNHCDGCFQPETWDFNYGVEYTPEIENQIITELKRPQYEGLTILGGEPFEPENQKDVLGLIRMVKEKTSDRNIWMYTGFVYEKDLLPGGRRHTEYTDEILDSIDILVDGRFELERKNISLRFRGSENQRILDMKRTRKEGRVIPSPLND